MIDLTGQTLGQYQILEQIGEGGMATVYKAFQPSLDRYVAIKILPPYFMHEAGFAERFEREAKAIAQLMHPNILPIYDFGREGDLSYIVMRYVDAGTLKARMAHLLPLGEIVRIVDNLAAALDYAHEQGVVHRDVKPANVLIDERGWVLLSDFGLAKMAEGSVALTGSGVGVGTPAYMSPEQGQGLKVDQRADVYSLGVMLYEMVVGRTPYDAETPFAIVLKHISDPLPLPRKVNPNLPEGVERVILKAMAKNRDDRFASAGDLAAALRAAVAELPDAAAQVIAPPAVALTEAVEGPPETAVVEPPAPTVVESSAPVRRLPWLWMAAGALAMILIVMAAIALLAMRQGKPEATPALVEATEPPALAQPTKAPAASQPPQPQPPTAKVGPPPEGRVPPEGTVLEDCGDDKGHICLHHPNDRLESILVDESLWLRSPTWSPDGGQIVVSASDRGDPYGDETSWAEGDLYLLDAACFSSPETCSDHLHRITVGDDNDIQPAWSPDGKWIAFHRNGDLALVRPDGSDTIHFNFDLAERCIAEPTWSPDSQRIAFLSIVGGCEKHPPFDLEVRVVGLNGEGDHSIWQGRVDDWPWAVAWAPDGEALAATVKTDDQDRWLLISLTDDTVSEMSREPITWLPQHWPPWGGEAGAPPPLATPPPPFEWTIYDDFDGDQLDTSRRWFAPPAEFPLEINLSNSKLTVRAKNNTDEFIGYPLVNRREVPVMAVEAVVSLDAFTGEESGFVGVGLIGGDDEFWLLALSGPKGDILLHHQRGKQRLGTQVVGHTDCCPAEHSLRLAVEGDRLLGYLDDQPVADVALEMKPHHFGLSIGLPSRAGLSAHINDVSVIIAE